MDYSSLLSDDQKRELLTQRIQQFAAEAYQHSLNLQVAQANSDTQAETIAQNAISTLDNALQVHIDALNALAPAVSTTPPIDPTASANPESAPITPAQ